MFESLSAAFWGFGTALQGVVNFFGGKKIANAEETSELVSSIFAIIDAVYVLLGGKIYDIAEGITAAEAQSGVIGNGIQAIMNFFM